MEKPYSKMKLAAIYNVWDGVELLAGSMACLKGHVDKIIIVYQDTSNYGEKYNPLDHTNLDNDLPIIFEKFYPVLSKSPAWNETQKRNAGIEMARLSNCTHFLHLDCDEYYEDFAAAKQSYIDSGAYGSVVRLHTYFREPTWRLDVPENYFVPFIHKLSPYTIAGQRGYPFHVDPTRRINEKNVVELPVFMHHFSWVRQNIRRKAENSSARMNIEKGTILEDYDKLAHMDNPEGFYIRDYDRHITQVENIFNIEI
jgi:hypothetical protein